MIEKLSQNKLVLSLVLSIFSTIAFVTISGFKFSYYTNDDYLISWLISNGEEKSFFINYFLQTFLVKMQSLLPFVDCFSLFQLIGCIGALISVNYVVLAHRKKIMSAIVSILVSVFICSTSIIMIQWTHTTTLMCVSGFVLLIHALHNENRKKYKTLQISLAAVQVILGSLLRFVSFEICVIFVGIFILGLLLEGFVKTKNTLLKRICTSIKEQKNIIIAITAIVVFSFMLNIASNMINNSDEKFVEHKSFNTARAQVTDYVVENYDGNEDFYNSIEIYSKEELDLAKIWHIDKDFYDTERFAAISDYANNDQDFVSNAKYVVTKTSKKIYGVFVGIKTKLNLPMSNLVFVGALGLLGAVLSIIWILVYVKLKNCRSLKYSIFLRVSAVLFVVVLWIIFALTFGINSNSVLTLIVLGFTIASAVICSKYKYLISLCLYLFGLALYIYQSYARMSFRVSFTIYVPVIILIAYIIISDQINVRYTKDAGAKVISVLVLLIVTVSASCVDIWINTIAPEIYSYDTTVSNYISQNTDILFFHLNKEYAKFDPAYTDAIHPVCYPENTIPYGGWQTASESYEAILESNSVEQLFLEMIDNPDRRFILSESGDYDIISIYETHYNNHYAPENKTIYLELEQEIPVEKTTWLNANQNESVWIYKVVTK